MDWTQAIAVIGSLGAFTFWLFTKLDADIRNSNQRVDQLYQMFIDLLKDKK
jgi:hypothetical protein